MGKPGKLISIILICGALLSILSVSGCAPRNEALEACMLYLEYIHSGEYGMAYDMLHSSARYDDVHYQRDIARAEKKREAAISEARDKGEPVDEIKNAELEIERSVKNISKEEFIERYTNIFDVLDITGISFEVTRGVEGDIICVYDYALVYESGLLEDEPMEFRMTVRREDGRWTVEWTPSLIFPEMQWQDTVRTGTIAARRGEILADGVIYAETVNAVSVLVYPANIDDPEQFARQVSALSNVRINTILDRIEKTKGDFFLLRQFYPDEFSDSLEQQFLAINGIAIDRNNFGTLRNYPQKDMLAHILGYVGTITREELLAWTGSANGDSIYNADSRIGKTGLELQYEEQLRGINGYFVYINTPDGMNRKTLYKEPARDGLDIQLTLNAALQDRADKLLKFTLYGDKTAGAVIVMNPETGKIEAMCSYPAYDLNLFTRGMTELEWQSLSSQENAPMFNRLTQGRYPPGSIFKPFTASAALESGAMTTQTVFPEDKEKIVDKLFWTPSDNGEFGPWNYAVITRVDINNRHRPLNMHNGMIDSDNIYFAYAALKTGSDYYSQFLDRIGMSEAIPFDVPVSPAQAKNEKSVWNPMLLAESAFGQGEILITPLQAASLFSALANNGNIMQPYLVEGLFRVEGISYVAEERRTPTVWKTNAISQASVQTLQPMLEDVVKSGTAYRLRMSDVAAKTGTAQIGSDRSREIIWLAAYRLRTDNPRLVLVMLEIPANESTLSSARFEIAKTLLSMEEE